MSRPLRSLIQRIALGEDRMKMVREFRRDVHENGVSNPPVVDRGIAESSPARGWLLKLERWADREGNAEMLLQDARSHYFHAIGLSNTGQHPDAYIEFAMALDGFSRFIERYPEDKSVPETLYLLGMSFLNLRDLLPDGTMNERFLIMCTDYFGDTVWGSQARRIWGPSRGGEPPGTAAREVRESRKGMANAI